jgi:hypothetical protein
MDNTVTAQNELVGFELQLIQLKQSSPFCHTLRQPVKSVQQLLLRR